MLRSTIGHKRTRGDPLVKALLVLAVLGLAQSQPPANVTGTWEWEGTAGWQRITLTLKPEGSSLTGVIRMGPGSREPTTPADLWEYFFDPVDFKISSGTISGNSISFEHIANKPSVSAQGVPVTSLRGIANNRVTVEPKFVYKGVVQADPIVMTREIVSDKRDPWALGVHKVEFVLRRAK
jgi:hypothetical protein